jgi:acyl carrier protein
MNREKANTTKISQYIVAYLEPRRRVGSTPLESGTELGRLEVDSIDMVKLILALQREFFVTFSAAEMEKLAQLKTPLQMAHLVAETIAGQT